MNAAPPLRALVAALVAFVVVVAAGLVLFALTPPAQRPDVWKLLPSIGPAAVVAVPALAAWLTGRTVHATVETHTEQLATISDNTNGKLDARIEAGVAKALAAAGLTTPDELPPVVPVVIPDQPAAPAGV